MKRVSWIIVSLLMIAAMLAGCAAPTPIVIEKVSTKVVEKEVVVTPTPLPATAVPTEGPVEKEAPILAELVAAGKLPPLEERLPVTPFVVGPGVLASEEDLPNWQPGVYGGTLRLVHEGGFSPELFFGMREPLLLAPGISVKNPLPNILQDFTYNNEYTEFTFTLRKGLKWSDGVPLTMDDIKFTFEGLFLDKEFSPNGPPEFMYAPDADRTQAKFEVLDDWTFRLTYAAPRGSLVKAFTIEGWTSYEDFIMPKHVAGKWHPKYGETAEINAELEKQSLKPEQWPQLFAQKVPNRWSTIAANSVNFPTLKPFVLTQLTEEAATFERNPYYYKVDTLGRQLPYLDKMISLRVSDSEMANVRYLSGDVDFGMNVAVNKAALFMERGKEAGFEVAMNMFPHSNAVTYYINGCTKDPIVKPVLNDLRFRQAFTYAINRAEIIDSVFLGFAQFPSYFDSAYDPEKANALLDEMGMDKRDGENFRLSPTGQKFTLIIEHFDAGANQQPATELVVAQLQEVGLRTELRKEPRSLFEERAKSDEVHISTWGFAEPTMADGSYGDYYPEWYWCPRWAWIEGAKDAQGNDIPRPEDLPAEVEPYRRIWLRDRVSYPPYSEEDSKLVKQVYDSLAKDLWVIDLVGKQAAPLLFNSKLGNVPSTGIQLGNTGHIEQMYYKAP